MGLYWAVGISVGCVAGIDLGIGIGIGIEVIVALVLVLALFWMCVSVLVSVLVTAGQHLGTSGLSSRTWGPLATSDHLGASGNIWEHLVTSGSI